MPQAKVRGDPASEVADRPSEPSKRDRRIEISLLHPDLRRLRRQLHLDCADVGAATQQVGRQVDDDPEFSLRDRVLAFGDLGQRPGGPGEQHAECVLVLAKAALELRDGGQGSQVLGLGLLHVQLRFVAMLEQPLGDLQAALLQRGVFMGNLQPQFDGADRTVEVGGLRCHQHLQIVILRDAGKIAGIRSLDAAPEFAPEIDFPADAETGVVGREGEVPPGRLILADAETAVVGREGDVLLRTTAPRRYAGHCRSPAAAAGRADCLRS